MWCHWTWCSSGGWNCCKSIKSNCVTVWPLCPLSTLHQTPTSTDLHCMRACVHTIGQSHSKKLINIYLRKSHSLSVPALINVPEWALPEFLFCSRLPEHKLFVDCRAGNKGFSVPPRPSQLKQLMQQLLGTPPNPQTQEYGKVKWKTTQKQAELFIKGYYRKQKSV